jgi:hypothetical protein
VSEAGPERDIRLIWLPSGRKAKLTNFAQGEAFDDLETAVTRALAVMPKGTLLGSVATRNSSSRPRTSRWPTLSSGRATSA